MAIETTVRTHTLKTDPDVFDAVASGEKTFEIRWNDRGYQVGDVLFLRKTRYTGAQMIEGLPLEYIGDPIRATVTYVLQGPVYGLAHGWVIMGIAVAAPRPEAGRQADLPRCKLCQCEPNESLSLMDLAGRYNCDSHDCPIAESGLTLTTAQWNALMDVDRDAVRLDWLIRKLSGKALRDAGVIYSAGTSTIRSAIDSAMGEQQ